MQLHPIAIELIKGLFTLAAVLVGSIVALQMYFRQKEYELTKQRSLEGGLDVIATELETALGVVSHNWARTLSLCKSFRDAGADFDVKELERGFLALDSSQFKQIAHHRVGSLLQSQIVWHVYQHAMAYATNANSRITLEIPEALRVRLTTSRISMSHEAMAEQLFPDLREIQQEGFKFASLLRELHTLSLELERLRLSLKSVSTFSSRRTVQESLQRLKAEFPPEAEAEASAA